MTASAAWAGGKNVLNVLREAKINIRPRLYQRASVMRAKKDGLDKSDKGVAA